MAGAHPIPSSAEAAEPDNALAQTLALIQADTHETLELVRSLVQLLLPKTEPKQGPTLEELIAAMVALLRDQMVLLRQIQADLGVALDRLPEPGLDGGEGQARHAFREGHCTGGATLVRNPRSSALRSAPPAVGGQQVRGPRCGEPPGWSGCR